MAILIAVEIMISLAPYLKTLKLIEYIIVNVVLCICVYLLYKGITLPIMSFNQFKFFGNTFSVLSGIDVLKQNNQIWLYYLVLVFSVIFPVAKLALLFLSWNTPYAKWKVCLLQAMIAVGRWSMLDVMIVAILVAWVKIDMIADVTTHIGLNYFISAVISILLIKTYITWRIKSSQKKIANKTIESS